VEISTRRFSFDYEVTATKNRSPTRKSHTFWITPWLVLQLLVLRLLVLRLLVLQLLVLQLLVLQLLVLQLLVLRLLVQVFRQPGLQHLR
jgi:hypothetical protein